MTRSQRTDSNDQATKQSPAEALSRRSFLAATAGGAAALGLAASQGKADPEARLRRGPGGLRGGGGTSSLDPDLVLLLNRATFGFTWSEYEYAETIGYDAYLQEQLNTLAYDPNNGGWQPDPGLDAHTGAYTMLDWTARQNYEAYSSDNMSYIAERQTTTIQLLWAVYSKAQLHHRMLEFWRHHFNIDIVSNFHQNFLMLPWLRDTLLANAMGTVSDIVHASAKDAAMMLYLNNDQNKAGSPNENYGRELLELHTLGVDNGYDQGDIQELARILTGWRHCLNFANGCDGGTLEYGDFRFYVPHHDVGPDKVLLGVTIPTRTGTDGILEGEEAIDLLVAHPNTAEYISRKLCRYFLGGLGYDYNPPEDVVQMAKWTYLNSDPIGDIKSMLQFILSRDVLTQYAVPKFKRPFDLVASSLRAVGSDLQPTFPSFFGGGNSFLFWLGNMGMVPSYWNTPDGPYDTQAWSEGGMFPRWQYLDKLSNNGLAQGGTISVGSLLASIGMNGTGLQAEGMSWLLTGGTMSDKEVENLQDFIGYGFVNEAKLREALWLAMTLPSYQFK